MKCVNCNSEIEQDAQFCPYCGKEVEHGKTCSKCGKPIDDDSDFCPYCGTKQSLDKKSESSKEINHPQEIEITKETQSISPLEKKGGGKKWALIIGIVLLLAIIGGGGYYFISNQEKGALVVQETDSIAENADSVMTTDEEAEAMNALAANNNSMEEMMIEERKTFIKEMYEDFFENHNFNIESRANLQKYLSNNVLDRIHIASPYDGDDGEKSYIVDCFRDGSLSFERPDYGSKVIKREINSIDYEWYEIVNIWDVINDPVKVRIKIGTDDNGNYKVVDFR